MADFLIRYPRNATGKFYVDRNCLDCAVCYEMAPQFFVRDDTGYSYVKVQPTDAAALDLCQKAMDGCPTNAIGNDGDAHDWDSSPIMAWDNLIEGEELKLKSPVVPRPEPE